MKQVVFNVGGALSTYIEYNNKNILVDVGSSSDYNPITDFLYPLYLDRYGKKNDKYSIDQLIISHPHNDHISAIKDFDKYFYAGLLTCPNDNDGMEDGHKINWKLVDNPTNDFVDYLRKNMLPGRTPPLKPANPINQFIYYIKPSDCEKNDNLESKNYTNNTSIVVYFRINNHFVFLPGDLMKDGMEYIINNESSLRRRLGEGVDVLIAPHHGLKSSFSTKLFEKMKNNKTRCLNIISEKPTTEDSVRIVDTRYSSKEYCDGKNNFSTDDSKVYQKKTSTGHIFIDYSKNNPIFKIITDNKKLLEEFK